MSPPSSATPCCVPPRLRPRLDAVKAGWQKSTSPDACAALVQDPELRANKAALLELAYEEFRIRLEAGEDVEPDSFCDRFPDFQSSLRRLLDLDSLMALLPASLSASGGGKAEQTAAQPARLWPPAQPRHWPGPGETVGDFTLVRELGRGAFARVFLATESSTGDRPVALKVSIAGGAEARTLGRLTHPHVVPVLSCRQDEATGLTLVCMPFLGSATLEDVRDHAFSQPYPRQRRASLILEAIRATQLPDDPPAASGPLDPRLALGSYTAGVLRLGMQLAKTLAFLHGQGVLHRDLKPSNVLLGPNACPRLLDFNLAEVHGQDNNQVGGTLLYAAPEHIRALLARGAAPMPDGRADLFSLGVILYELLTGSHPLGSIPRSLAPQALAELLLQRQQQPCPSLACEDLDPSAARLLADCLAFDPGRRPVSAQELAAKLRAYFRPGRRLRRWARRRWVLLGSLILLAAGTAAWPAAAPSLKWSPGTGFREPHDVLRYQSPEGRSAYDLGRDAFRAGRYEEAEEHFVRALTAAPEDLRSRFAHACTLMKQGQTQSGDRATTLLSIAVTEFAMPPGDPREGLAFLCRAYCYAWMGHHAVALENANRAVKAGNHSTALCNNRAYSYAQRADLEKAARDLSAISPQQCQHPAVCWNRARLALKHRLLQPQTLLPESALQDVCRAVEAGPVSRQVDLLAANLHILAAQDDARRQVALAAPLQMLGLCAHSMAPAWAALRDHRIGQALAFLRRALEHGSDPSALDNPVWKPAQGWADFQALRKAPPAPSRPVRDSLPLIDPIVDLPD